MAPARDTEDTACRRLPRVWCFPQTRKHDHPGPLCTLFASPLCKNSREKSSVPCKLSQRQHIASFNWLLLCSIITPSSCCYKLCRKPQMSVMEQKQMWITVETKHDYVQLWQRVAPSDASKCRWWIRIFESDNSQRMFSKSQCIWKCWHANISTQPLKQIGFYESPFYAIYYST